MFKDFSQYPRSTRYYGGTERKLGIVIGGREYLVKFPKETPFGRRNNHFSEYVASHLLDRMGFEVQETWLGTFEGTPVVLCRNFLEPGEQFVPFNDVGESTLDEDKERFQYSYDDILTMLRANTKLTGVEECVGLFWELFIADALLGNFDRHGGNWGFLKTAGKYRPAPIFDNGSSLFPNLTDENTIREIIASSDETNARVFSFPTSQILLNGKKSSYYEVIHSLAFPECNDALVKMMQRIDMTAIQDFLQGLPAQIPAVLRDFYQHILRERYEKILLASYTKLEALR